MDFKEQALFAGMSFQMHRFWERKKAKGQQVVFFGIWIVKRKKNKRKDRILQGS